MVGKYAGQGAVECVLKVLQAKATTTAKKVNKKSVPSENIFQGWRQKTILVLDK